MGARYLVVATMAALVVQVGCREQTLPTAPRSSAPPLAANAPVPVPGREVVFECFTSYQVRGDPLPYRYGHVGLPISGSEVDASAGHLFQFHYRRYAADGHVLRLANCQLPATPVAVAFATAFFRLRPQANARSSGLTSQPRIETSASEIVPPPPDFCSLYPSDPACLPMDPGTCDPTIDSCGTTGAGPVISYEITSQRMTTARSPTIPTGAQP